MQTMNVELNSANTIELHSMANTNTLFICSSKVNLRIRNLSNLLTYLSDKMSDEWDVTWLLLEAWLDITTHGYNITSTD